MSRIAVFVTDNARIAWAVAAVVILAGSLLAGWVTRDVREAQRLSALKLDSERRGIELMSLTLNGNLMGAISLIGLLDEDVRHDAAGSGELNAPHLAARLEAPRRPALLAIWSAGAACSWSAATVSSNRLGT